MNEIKFLRSEDLKVGTVFVENGGDEYSYVYIGAKPFYDWHYTDDNIFSSHYQTEELMMHVFYCIENEEYTSLRWSTTTISDEIIEEDFMEAILEDYMHFPIGKKIKSIEFNPNVLSYSIDNPLNIEKNKCSIFYESFFKELDKNNQIYLALTLKDEDDYPDIRKYAVSIIKIVDDDMFRFDYISMSHVHKYKEIINTEEIESLLLKVKEITNQRLGFFAGLSKNKRNKHIEEKLKSFKELGFGSLSFTY